MLVVRGYLFHSLDLCLFAAKLMGLRSSLSFHAANMRILSHNVFWFQGVPFAGDSPGPPRGRVVDALGGIYHSLRPDVLCLQEIQSKEAFQAIAQRMEMRGIYRPGSLYPQYGCAVLVREGLELALLEAETLPTESPQRCHLLTRIHPVADSGKSWILANVHLPSGRQVGPEAAKAIRAGEVAQTLRWKPLIMLGDFNETPGGGTDALLQDHGYEEPCSEQAGEMIPSTLGGRRIDRFWIQQTARNGMFSRISDLQALETNRMRVADGPVSAWSDHLPIWVDLLESPLRTTA